MALRRWVSWLFLGCVVYFACFRAAPVRPAGVQAGCGLPPAASIPGRCPGVPAAPGRPRLLFRGSSRSGRARVLLAATALSSRVHGTSNVFKTHFVRVRRMRTGAAFVPFVARFYVLVVSWFCPCCVLIYRSFLFVCLMCCQTCFLCVYVTLRCCLTSDLFFNLSLPSPWAILV